MSRLPPREARAFTLIEAMVVVVVVGILAVLATVVYRVWVRTSYMAEAQDMVVNIRTAEESFRAENGVYLDVSSALDLGHLYPRNPGAYKTAWGAPCLAGSTLCPAHDWAALTIAPQAPLAFGYALQADNSGTAAAPSLSSYLTSSPAPNLAAMTGQPWYIVEAVGDINGDGIYTRVFGFSGSPRLLVDNEGN